MGEVLTLLLGMNYGWIWIMGYYDLCVIMNYEWEGDRQTNTHTDKQTYTHINAMNGPRPVKTGCTRWDEPLCMQNICTPYVPHVYYVLSGERGREKREEERKTRKFLYIYIYIYIYMGGISRDVKRLKKWNFYPIYFGFSWPFTVLLLWWKLPCVLSS